MRVKSMLIGLWPESGEAHVKKNLVCPQCGGNVPVYANPQPTADVIIHTPESGIVLIRRKNIPLGYALPGGFVDEGEWVEDAAIREMAEETELSVVLEGVLGVYSRPDRDPRTHTMSVTFVGFPRDPGALRAGDDAGEAFWCLPEQLPNPMCFDHARMIADFLEWRAGRRGIAGLSSEWCATKPGRANALELHKACSR